MSTAAATPAGAPYPWQEEQWRLLHAAHARGQLANAYLLWGDAGLGKADFAMAAAEAMLCNQPDERGRACGACASCRQCGDDGHPDLLPVAPEEGATVIGVEQIRAVGEFTQRSGHVGRGKFVVILQAHRMNLNAANALLKTLEEPKADTTLLLVSEIIGMLLPTVRSRCRKLAFNVPQREVAEVWLKAREPDAPVAEWLNRAGGSPLRALDYASADALEAGRELNDSLMGIWRRQATPEGAAVTLLKRDFERLIAQLRILAAILIKGVCADTSAADSEQAAGFEGEFLAELRQWRGSPVERAVILRRLLTFHERVAAAERLARGGANPNPQLQLEALLLHWQSLPYKPRRAGRFPKGMAGR